MNLILELRESLFLFIANNLPRLNIFNRIRYQFIKLAGANILGKCTIWSGFDIRPIGCCSNLTIGKGVFINKNFRCAMPAGTKVIIGKGTAIGPNVMIETAFHGLTLSNRKSTQSKSVTIGKHVWVGAGVIILAGVNMGDNSVIAAGSVVTKDVEPNVLMAGVPAVQKKIIDNEC